jgi:hypothetical protein
MPRTDAAPIDAALACRVCGANAPFAFTATLLGDIRADFNACPDCGFLQARDPYWLDRAYQDAVVAADTGVLQRNVDLARLTSVLLSGLFGRDGRFLDFAGGYGIYVRLMRDLGFDFRWTDRYCENVFARGFEGGRDDYVVVTAFEVIEHLPDPIEFVRSVLEDARSDSLLFTTELFEGDPPAPGEWWYYCFEAGQHISFFQRRTLERIAARFDSNLYSNGKVHLITRRRISPWLFRLLARPAVARVLGAIMKRRSGSLTLRDHEHLMAASAGAGRDGPPPGAGR